MRAPAARLAARAAAAGLLAGLGAGCYRYVPVDVASARPGEELRVRVTDAGAARLARELGTYAGQLEGQVARVGDSVSVAVAIGREYRGVTLESARQTLYLGRAEVVEVQRRELSRRRTVLTVAGSLVAFALLAGTVQQLGDDNSPGDEPPPPPPAFRVPARAPLGPTLLRLPLRLPIF